MTPDPGPLPIIPILLFHSSSFSSSSSFHSGLWRSESWGCSSCGPEGANECCAKSERSWRRGSAPLHRAFRWVLTFGGLAVSVPDPARMNHGGPAARARFESRAAASRVARPLHLIRPVTPDNF